MTPPTKTLPSNTSLVNLLKYINKVSLWLKQSFSKGIKYNGNLASEIVTTVTSMNQISILANDTNPLGLLMIDAQSHTEQGIQLLRWKAKNKKIDIELSGIDPKHKHSLKFLIIYG